jgi:phosphoenolpyruvate synthase/pyruvate phosphate dikinase
MGRSPSRLLTVEDAACAGASVVGGKAFSLAQLARYGIAVPRSAVILVDPDGDVLATPDLLECLAHMDLAERPLAVRSSAVGEDGTRHSFAGIHASVLGVQGPAALEAAIKTVVESYRSEAALAYRARIGVPLMDGPVPVLLCEMVGAPASVPECAGVAFSCDPVSGSLDDVVVELVSGLADRLVNGTVTPRRARISLRTAAIAADPGFLDLLPERFVHSLVRTVMRIEWALNGGDDEVRFDVEWAFDGRKIIVVQARPVTKSGYGYPVPGPAIWSQANLVEVLPGIMSPLSWSLTRPGIRWVLREPFDRAGHQSPESLALVRRTDGRPFIELSAIQWLGWTNFGTPPSAINENLGGEAPEIEAAAKPVAVIDKARQAGGALRLLRKLARLKFELAPQLLKLKRQADAVVALSLCELPREQLCKEWEQLALLSLDLPLGLAASAAVPWLTISHQLLQNHLAPDEISALIGGLMAGRRGTVSAEHALALAQIGSVHEEHDKTVAREAFLETFGHRGFGELELENPRWRDRPSELAAFEQGALDPQQLALRIAQRRRDAEHMLVRLPWWKRRLVRGMIDKIGAGFAIREEARSESVRVLGGFRAIALEVERRLREQGMLLRQDDVFYLTVPDIMAYLHGDWDGAGAIALVKERARQRETWRAMPGPPHILRPAGDHSAQLEQLPPHRSQNSDLYGIGAAPGEVAGTARVVTNPREHGAFQAGDILVAVATDPAWTPLFLKAGGIVVEHGGYLSHGAIIAREFGIPAVVNVKGARERLAGAPRVAIDGSHGTVALEN